MKNKFNKKNLTENFVHGIFLILGLITVASVLVITVYLVISGIPAIRKIGLFKFLFGMYNLCDNAIKYGREGGYVHVTVESGDGKAVLTVKDNGIGIAPEHQARVFERFYRVDKSRSRESGGTGLGLSIVKHAVAVHHGEISLDSRLGEGTEIKISFPI